MNNINIQIEQTAQWAGLEAANDYFNGNYEALDGFLLDALSDDERVRLHGENALAGFMFQSARILDCFQAEHQVTFTPKPPSLAKVSYLLSCGRPSFDSEPLPALIASIKALKAKCPGARAGFKVEKAPSEAAKEDKPTKIEIIAMPVRESVQTLERDQETQEITKTTHRERDA